MTSAVDVLAYIRRSFNTLGRLQRLKILYYAQVWHLAWQGSPLFEEDVQAWQMGPVVPEAWRADRDWDEGLTPKYVSEITPEQSRIVDAIWEFYGRNHGTALSALTHDEEPWIRHYNNVNIFLRGSDVIPKEEMRSYYSMLSLSNHQTPRKPALQPQNVSDEELFAAFDHELPRWEETLRLLADR